MQDKFHPEIPTGSLRVAASNKSGLGETSYFCSSTAFARWLHKLDLLSQLRCSTSNLIARWRHCRALTVASAGLSCSVRLTRLLRLQRFITKLNERLQWGDLLIHLPVLVSYSRQHCYGCSGAFAVKTVRCHLSVTSFPKTKFLVLKTLKSFWYRFGMQNLQAGPSPTVLPDEIKFLTVLNSVLRQSSLVYTDVTSAFIHLFIYLSQAARPIEHTNTYTNTQNKKRRNDSTLLHNIKVNQQSTELRYCINYSGCYATYNCIHAPLCGTVSKDGKPVCRRALEVFLNDVCCINPRFTYLLTCVVCIIPVVDYINISASCSVVWMLVHYSYVQWQLYRSTTWS